MDKEQSKGLQLKCQIKKDRVPGYPFYVVTTTYSQQDFNFLFAVDYTSDITLISIYPFKKDTKLMTTTLQLTDILSRKIVSTIHVNNFVFKPSSSSISVVVLQLALGYRSGQLVVVQYKDKDWKIKEKLNRSIKNEGLFHRTTSAIFGAGQCYNVYHEYPIRSLRREANQIVYKYFYQVGNRIILCKQLNESNQNKLLSLFDSMDKKVSEANHKKIVQNGDYFVYNCQHYSVLSDQRSYTCLLDFKNAISSYLIQSKSRELIVSSKETIFLINIDHQFTLRATITIDMPIRSVQTFTFSKQVFLAILPYDNYLLILSLTRGSFIKLGGHKSYIASICLLQKQGKIVAAGMDHRISLISISKIKKEAWTAWTLKNQEQIVIKESQKPLQKFEDVFSLGKSSESNIARNNLHSYGFGHCFVFQNCIGFCTYDYRIMIYDFSSSP